MKRTAQLIILIFIIGFSTLVMSQNQYLRTPPKVEDTYLFNITSFNRQPKIPQYMMDGFQQLLNTPESKWAAKDSLFYAYQSAHSQKFGQALNVFSKLKGLDTIKEKQGQQLYRATLQQEKRFHLLVEYNNATFDDEPEKFYSFKSAFSDLTKAYIKHNENNFDIDSDTIFSVLYSDTLKTFNRKEIPNKNKLVEIALAVDSALRQFSMLHDKRDIVLSKAFEEMADYQWNHFYVSNAHFYYSVSLHYDKNNKAIFANYNKTKTELSDKNLFPISFKGKFGKIIKNRYRLSEDFTAEVKDSVKRTPVEISLDTPEKKKDLLPWIDGTVLIMIVLGLVLIFVVLFLKTKE